MMREKVAVAAVGAMVAAGTVGVGTAVAVGSDDQPATGPRADAAGQAAQNAAGGGTTSSVERDVEGGVVWEVEVAQAVGRAVEVDLDQSLNVVATEREDDSTDGANDADEGVDDANDVDSANDPEEDATNEGDVDDGDADDAGDRDGAGNRDDSGNDGAGDDFD